VLVLCGEVLGALGERRDAVRDGSATRLATTEPTAILGVFGSTDSSVSSRTHLAAIRVDSFARLASSNRPIEVKAPSSASNT
jgi:hypothetical protein